jgi:hypothetical protein
MSVQPGERAMSSSGKAGQAMLATLTTAETAARAGAVAIAATTVAIGWGRVTEGNRATTVAIAWVCMTEGSRAAGHSATRVFARVGDSRSTLRKLLASHNSRADAATTCSDHGPGATTSYHCPVTTPSDHGPGAAPDNRGSDCPLPVKLMWAARSAGTPWDNAGRAAGVIEHAMACQGAGTHAAAVAVNASGGAVRAHAVRTARNSMQRPRKVAQYPVYRARRVPEGSVGAADVIRGIVAVGDRWC